MSAGRRERIHDVVVGGGDGAGLAAAIEARILGREVLLLEKNPALGGSTAWSIGSITSSATPHQIRRGNMDCPADHCAGMPAFARDLALRARSFLLSCPRDTAKTAGFASATCRQQRDKSD